MPPSSEVFYSPDGSRAVWVRGSARDAFLYDRTGAGSWDPRWLDWDVMDVRYYMDAGGVSEIELIRWDGQHSWFDADGNRNGGALEPPPPAPEEPAPTARRDLGKAVDASPSLRVLSVPSLHWD